MKKLNKKNVFFDLSVKEKVKIVRKAAQGANKEQFELIKRQGGVSELKRFCNCT